MAGWRTLFIMAVEKTAGGEVAGRVVLRVQTASINCAFISTEGGIVLALAEMIRATMSDKDDLLSPKAAAQDLIFANEYSKW
jgi:hypothetical protein